MEAVDRRQSGQFEKPTTDLNGDVANLENEKNKVVELQTKAPSNKTAGRGKVGLNPDTNSIATKLLLLEARLRETENLAALRYFAVNEFQQLVPATQIMIFQKKSGSGSWKVETVSSLAVPDHRSPLLQWLVPQIADQLGKTPGEHPKSVRLETEKYGAPIPAFSYGFIAPLCHPERQPNTVIVFFSERPLTEQSQQCAVRLSKTLAHAWRVFERNQLGSLLAIPKPFKLIAILALLAVLFIPVPLTVLAPAEIVAEKPDVIAAPISGVIQQIHVLPNQQVKKGDLLFSFDKTEALSRLEQAKRSLLVAEAKYRRANQSAFGNSTSKGEMAIAKAEVDLALIEKQGFERRLALADVHAETPGLVLFESVEKWTGRPVNTGERVMRIANSDQLNIRVDLASDDAIVLDKGAGGKLFLDSNPLQPLQMEITRTAYEASMSEKDILVFPLFGKLGPDSDQKNLRIGLRGTAQVYSDKVPLWFFLFRKPLSYLRQLTGI